MNPQDHTGRTVSQFIDRAEGVVDDVLTDIPPRRALDVAQPTGLPVSRRHSSQRRVDLVPVAVTLITLEAVSIATMWVLLTILGGAS